ncbi:Ribonuclease/ribotoxin [Powellomyces hirtus]|nr:Ribonuclease/ribotoxin [Powellomyces hirtus]
MKFTALLSALPILAAFVCASPIPSPQDGEVCGPQRITSRDISSAMSAGAATPPSGFLEKRYEPYPHAFDNREGFLTGACAKQSSAGNTMEYPIIPGGVYDGGQPGKYRVIYYVDESNGPVYCAAVYHDGKGNTFSLCVPK